MRIKYILIGAVVGVLLTSAAIVLAGNLDSPGLPGATNSYSLEDIYDRLDTGAAGAQTAFTEPAAGPGSTMHTLNEIYDLIGKRAPVPKTGAGDIAGYDEVAGEDGLLQKGVTWPTPRFTDNSDGTVTDNLTGLIWLKNANCPNAWRDWATALGDVAQLNTDGTMNGNNCGDTSNGGTYQTDWRLPNVRELHSLIHYGVYNPAVPNTAGTGKWAGNDPFTGVLSGYYWSSTTCAGDTDYAWYVRLYDGYVYSGGKAGTYYVWPVRGEQ